MLICFKTIKNQFDIKYTSNSDHFGAMQNALLSTTVMPKKSHVRQIMIANVDNVTMGISPPNITQPAKVSNQLCSARKIWLDTSICRLSSIRILGFLLEHN